MDDGRALNEAECGEYYEAFHFYYGTKPTLTIHEKDELRVGVTCGPLVRGQEEDKKYIRNLVIDLLRNANMDPLAEASSTRLECNCLIGAYSLVTHRPRHTVRVDLFYTDNYGQRNSMNGVAAHQYIASYNHKAGSTLVVSVDGKETKRVFVTPIVKCETELDHRDFVKATARREMEALLPPEEDVTWGATAG